MFYDFAPTKKFYRKEYKRLLKENGELWEENQKIKKSYDALKAKIFFICFRLECSYESLGIERVRPRGAVYRLQTTTIGKTHPILSY